MIAYCVYNFKIKIYGYHYIHAVCLLSSTAYSIIVTVLNEILIIIKCCFRKLVVNIFQKV